MPQIRPLRREDRDAVNAICLKTGDAGQDATALYRDPDLLGHLYAGPYAALEPESGFILEDEEGAGGYILGARNTYADRKSTRLNSSHPSISYAVFCLKK